MGARIHPDGISLQIAHQQLRTTMSLPYMLGHPALRLVLENVARLHMERRARQQDTKRLQANDID